jgi:pyridoxal 5'-phosphate synthase pdxS subunit
MRSVQGSLRKIAAMREEELMTEAKNLGAPYDLVLEVHRTGKLPVPNFSAGGCATPADAALMMQLGAEAVFVGSGIFKAASGEPDPELRRELTLRRAKAIVDAVTFYNDPQKLAEVSTDLGEPMSGLDTRTMDATQLMASRGW